MRKYNIPRQKLVILSKCFAPVGEEPNVRGIMYPDKIQISKDYVNQYGQCDGRTMRPCSDQKLRPLSASDLQRG